jgi:glycosyltransferase involved in cell wall biosynthesis
MNGGMNFPPGFGREGRAEHLFTRAARWASPVAHYLLPGKLRAETLLVANERTRHALPHGAQGQVIELVENSVDLSLWEPVHEHPPGPVEFVFAGRLVAFKAVDLLLAAFRQVAGRVGAKLHIIGTGPERPRLEARARELGLGDRVTFHGWLPQEGFAQCLRRADVFVFPSLYDCGGAAVLEAMAAGLPVVAACWGGPADYLTPECGILVEPTDPATFVNGLARAMIELARDPGLRRRMGEAARRRAETEFDWERKIDRILDIYTAAIAAG